jgi:hypothetical protein
MTAYNHKSLTLSADKATTITAEVDTTGAGDWVKFETYDLAPGKERVVEFPSDFSAYWIRFTSEQSCKASAQLEYR